MRRVKKAASRPAARRRPQTKPVMARRGVRLGLSLGTLVVLVVGGWQFWSAGWIQQGADRAKDRLVAISAGLGFVVQEINVEGRYQTPANDLRKALRLERGAPILAFDPDAAYERLKALPWIRTVTVERRLPDTVSLKIVERKPIALWQKDGAFSLIDTEGAVIPIDDVGQFAALPIVVGAGAAPHAAPLIEMLAAEPTLAGHVRAAVWVGDRRWDLHCDSDVVVRLPEEDTAAAWHRFTELERSDKLLAHNYSVIDLRLKDRVIVREGGSDGDEFAGRNT